MRRLLFVLVAFVVLAGFVQPVLAQTAPGQEEMVSVPKSQLTASQIATVEQDNLKRRIETYGKWVGLGKEVGEAVNGSLGALTKQADEFSKTGVGQFTMILIAWKVIGTDLIQFLVGVPLLLVGFVIWTYSYYKNCIPRRVLKEERDIHDGGKVREYEADEPDKEEQFTHFVVLLVWVVVCTLIIFL